MSTFIDIRQAQTRVLQDQLDSAATTEMDSVLASINNELTPPGRLIAQDTPSLVVTIGSGTIVNPNTSKNRILPPVNSTTLNFAGGTITFPSASGTITVSPGSNSTITIGANQFVAVLVQLNSSGQLGLSVGAPASSLGTVIVPGGSPSSLSLGYIVAESNGSSVIQNITNAMLYQFVGGGGGGGDTGGDLKNYLTSIITSTSGGVPNPGNGNFESASTSGWSLAHSALTNFQPTSTASAGNVFSATSGGSAASGNLSLSLISSGQLAGSYSGDLASSMSSVGGDMLISSAFNIDTEDQAKMMQVKFYYKAVSGTFNFSGTNSNTFAVYIYDVTNGAWIQPQGVYNLVQSSGTGYCTATFQTTSNSSQYQLALININGTSGGYSLYIDDFSVGPQIAPSGPAMSDWTAYTAVLTATGTNPSYTVYNALTYWRRVGENLEILFSAATNGSTFSSNGTGTYLFNLPPGLSADSTKLEFGLEGTPVGQAWIDFNGSSEQLGSVYVNDIGHLFLQVNATSTNTTLANLTNSNFSWTSANGIINFTGITIPIVGWSSNTAVSSDTDTRVCAVRYRSTQTTTIADVSFTQINFNVLDIDTHGAVSNPSSNWTFTAPISGIYDIQAVYSISTTTTVGVQLTIWKNGSQYASGEYIAQGTSTSNVVGSGVSSLVPMNAGDTLTILGYTNGGPKNLDGNGFDNWVSINRLSGPAVIAATETVALHYNDNSGIAIADTGTLFKYNTKDFDTHNAYNSSTGTWTCPVSGTYTISASLATATTSVNGVAFIQIDARKNGGGASWTAYDEVVTSTATNIAPQCNGSVTLRFNAGDTVQFFGTTALANNGSLSSTTTVYNNLSIVRVGN